MDVSEIVVPPKHPKMIIFSRKTYGCWVPPFQETPIYTIDPSFNQDIQKQPRNPSPKRTPWCMTWVLDPTTWVRKRRVKANPGTSRGICGGERSHPLNCFNEYIYYDLHGPKGRGAKWMGVGVPLSNPC